MEKAESDTLFPDSTVISSTDEGAKNDVVFVSPKKMRRAPSASERNLTCSYPSQSGVDSISSSLQHDLDAMLNLPISLPSPGRSVCDVEKKESDMCVFSTGRGKKIEVSEEKMREAEVKLNGYMKEEEKSGGLCLFSTGRGKKLTIDENKLKEAEKKLNGYMREEEEKKEESGVSLFSTGRGKRIVVSEEKMKEAESKLNGYLGEEEKEESGVSLFSTGRGKKLKIDDNKLKEAEKKLDGYMKEEKEEPGVSLFTTGRGKKIEVSEEKRREAENKLNGYAKEEEEGMCLFSTGRGKRLRIDESKLKEAEVKLNGYMREEEKEESGVSLFSTGRGKRLKIDEKRLREAKERMDGYMNDEEEKKEEGMSLFSTGRGRKIEVSEEKMREAENKLNGYAKEEKNEGMSLFTTGRGKKLTIDENKLKEAENKLNGYSKEETKKEEGMSLFTTGRGKKIEVSEEKMKEAENKLNGYSKEEKDDTPSLFTTGRGKQVAVSSRQLAQASALLDRLAEQDTPTIQRPERASPDRVEEQHMVEKVGSQRVSVAVGGGPRKPQLAPPSPKKEKNLHKVNREAYEKNMGGARKKKKEYVPIRIMNNNFIYSQPDARSSRARLKGQSGGAKGKAVSEAVQAMMKKWDYCMDVTDSPAPENGAFSRLTQKYGTPFHQEYSRLHESVRTTLENGGMQPRARDALEATDLFFALSQCEYNAQKDWNEALARAGVNPFLLSITSRNAEFVVFASDALDALPVAFHTADTPNPMFERLLELMRREGAEASLLTPAWLRCQYRNVLWKQASKARWAHSMEPCRLRLVLQNCLWRYFTELFLARPPPLKRLVQRDESEARFVTLVVSDVLACPPLSDYDQVEEAPAEKKEIPAGVVELTDGWYFIEAALDPALTALLQVHLIYPGLKLRVACARIQNNNSGCAPLEMRVNQPRRPQPRFFSLEAGESGGEKEVAFFGEESAAPRYMLQYNNTRRATWNGPVGFVPSYTFNTNINDCINEGGPIPQTDVVVVRKYGVRFQEQVGERRVYRTEEEERREQKRWEEAYAGVVKEVVAKKEKAWEAEDRAVEEEAEWVRSRREQERQSEIESEAQRVMEARGMKERVVSMIGYLQVVSPYRFEAEEKEKGVDVNSLCLMTGGKVDPVVGASHHIYDTISVTLWNTNAAMMESLKEGCVYRVTMLQAQQSVDPQRNELLLSTSNGTRWEDITDAYKKARVGKKSVFDVWRPRQVASLKAVETEWREKRRTLDCDLLLFFLFSSAKKQNEKQGFYYEITFCDISGHVAILTVSEAFFVTASHPPHP